MSTRPVEDDFKEAVTLVRLLKLKPSSSMLWELATAVHELRAKGPAETQDPEAPVYFHPARPPYWDDTGARILHRGHRYLNGLIAVCGVQGLDTADTFTGELTPTCARCLKELEISARVKSALKGAP